MRKKIESIPIKRMISVPFQKNIDRPSVTIGVSYAKKQVDILTKHTNEIHEKNKIIKHVL